MNGLYHEYHQGVDIIVIDYSIVPHEDEFGLMKYSLDYLSSTNRSDNHVLEIISKVKLTHEIMEYLPEYIKHIKHFVRRWASIGIGGALVKKIPDLPFGKGRDTKNKNIEWFDTKEEAIDFLVSGHKEQKNPHPFGSGF